MNEDDMTLDQIIAFHTLMCEAQKCRFVKHVLH